MGRLDLALDLYRRMLELEAEPWQYSSTALQAGHIAGKLGDRQLADSLEELFTPSVHQANRILLGYSPEDVVWKDRLCQMLSPFLRDGEIELQLWKADEGIESSDGNHELRRSVLVTAGVTVLLISAPFLASEYVRKWGLADVMNAAAGGESKLFWVYLSHAGYAAAGLGPSHGAHDISQPLYVLTRPEQDAVLLQVAQDIKAAALGATDQYRGQPTMT